MWKLFVKIWNAVPVLQTPTSELNYSKQLLSYKSVSYISQQLIQPDLEHSHHTWRFFSNDWPILLFVFFSFCPSKPRDVWFHWRRALWACKIWVSFTISHWKTAKGPWWYRLPVIWPILRLSRRHWISSGYHFQNFNSDEWWQTKRVQPAISY